MAQHNLRVPGKALQREQPARCRTLTAEGREKAFDEDALPTARAAEGSKCNRLLQTRRCHGNDAELKGKRGTGGYCVGSPLPSPEHRRAINAQQELLFY